MATPRLLLLLTAAALAAACQPAPTTPTPSAGVSANPSADPGASGAPSAAPSASPSGEQPSAAPSTLPSGGASVAPSAAPTPAAGNGILRGVIYDGKLARVPDGTTITARSLDASVGYTATVLTADGNYVLNQVPIGVQIEIAATRPGWTRRTRVGVVRQPDPRRSDLNIFHFGGRATDEDRGAPAFYLSPYPEIERVAPTDQDTSLPAGKLSFTITMSEALSAENRRRLAAAFTILPNNREALAENVALPAEPLVNEDPDDPGSDLIVPEELKGLRIGSATAPVLRYAFRQNSGFLNGFETSTFTWDADGRVATFTMSAPLKTGRTDEGEYAFMLIQQDEDEIVDAEGNQLGTDEEGEWGQLGRGQIIYNAIAEPSISLNVLVDDEQERWVATHQTFTTFGVEADSLRPKLVSVVARRNYTVDETLTVDRIELTFSEPMIAYPRISSPGLLSLNNYVFAAAATEDLLTSRNLRDGSPSSLSPNSTGTNVQERFEEKSSVAVGSNRDDDGNFRVSMSVKDPKVVIFEMPAGSFPLDADFLKVFAGGDDDTTASDNDVVTDPAGNALDTGANAQVGPIF